MSALRNRVTLVWLLLVAVTLGSWRLAAGGGLSHGVTAAVVLVAAVKTRLVVTTFMEVRTAPLWLRLTCDAWLVTVFTIILATAL